MGLSELLKSLTMKPSLLFLPLAFIIVFSCQNKKSQSIPDEETYLLYLQNGSVISAIAQTALLSHVSGAMKEGGSLHAVEFCSLSASGITDSINTEYNCSISRVTDKNRNPDNGLKSRIDQQLWDYYLSGNDGSMLHDTVLVEGQKAIYYKPIITGMPACLQCHGPENEIDPVTYKKITEIYPDDKATGYALNDLRGLWKIEFGFDNNISEK